MNEKFLVPLSIIIAGVIIAVSVFVSSDKFNLKNWSNSQSTAGSTLSPAVGPQVVPNPSTLKVDLGTNPVLGNPKALVEIVEFGDYQCPFCGQFFQEIEPQLKRNFIDSGKAKFAYRDLAFLGQESKDAALAARCANEQGQYWTYHDELFGNQRGENQGAFKAENLIAFAKALGLQAQPFADCYQERRYDPQIQADIEAAGRLGVFGTPTLFVNGQIFPAWSDYPKLKSLIESLLAN